MLLDSPTPFVSHARLAYIRWVPILHYVPSFHAFGNFMFHHFLFFLSLFTLLFLLLFLSLFLNPLAKMKPSNSIKQENSFATKNEFCNGCMKKKGSIMDVWRLNNYLCFPNDKLFLLIDIKIFNFEDYVDTLINYYDLTTKQ